MGFMDGLKKYAVAKFEERRYRQTVMFLDSLPDEIKKDIGWNGSRGRNEQ
jgi:hypothetical protein